MSKRSIISGLTLLLLLAFIVVQAYYIWNDYAYIQGGYAKRYGLIESVARSSILIFKRDSANYLRFLDLYIPQEAAVVLPPDNEAGNAQRQKWFSSQSMMQFFLFPRRIWLCDQDMNSECIKSLTHSDSFVLAFGEFPPPDYMEGKELILFPGAVENIKGVYVPINAASQLPVPSLDAYSTMPGIPLVAPLIDTGMIIAFLVLGFFFVNILVFQPNWLDVLTLSFPIAIGLFSWVVFLVSYLGVPINLLAIILCFGFLLSGEIFLYRWMKKTWPVLPQSNPFEPVRQVWKNDRAAFILGLAVFLWFGLSGLISISRGYSVFDDIVNWALKGYAMAYRNSIWASNLWGGHAMAYPMNLQLSISAFWLADGDVLPGSKAIFPILTMNLMLGCYWFWRRHGVAIKIALLGMLLIFTLPFFFWYSTSGFANIPFTTYLILGTLWTIEGIRGQDNRMILMGGFLFAFAGWTRPEGMGYSIIMLVVIYLCAKLFLRINPSIWQVTLSILPTSAIPLIWFLLVGQKAMRDDQIGSVIDTFLQILQDGINLKAWVEIYNYARSYFLWWRDAGYAIPVSFLILVVMAPISRWYKKGLQVSLILLTLTAALFPAAMFYINSFSETNFSVFLEVSLTRAYIPAIVLLVISAILVLGSALLPKETGDEPPNRPD